MKFVTVEGSKEEPQIRIGSRNYDLYDAIDYLQLLQEFVDELNENPMVQSNTLALGPALSFPGSLRKRLGELQTKLKKVPILFDTRPNGRLRKEKMK